jgi:hypothetical protein
MDDILRVHSHVGLSPSCASGRMLKSLTGFERSRLRLRLGEIGASPHLSLNLFRFARRRTAYSAIATGCSLLL